MRVLILSGYSHPSHHRKVELLANVPGVEILHILQPGNGKAAGWHPSANGERSYRVAIVPLRTLGVPGDPHRTIYWPPSFQLRHFKPDVIHCEHEQESLMALEVVLARVAAGVQAPLILYAWQNILRQRRWAVRQASAITLRSAQHIVCASHQAVEVLQRQGYRGGVSVMPLFGLDTRYFHPQPANEVRQRLQLNHFAVGYVGRLVIEKGVDTLLQAAALVTRPLQLVLIGRGPEQAKLQSLAQELGLGECCRFVGEVPYDQIAQYLSALDLLVLPSRTTPNWKEQYGRVLVEAMACKIVVAGSNSGAIPEVIGAAGRLFPEGDVDALSALIDELAANLSLRQALADQGYQRALTHYTVEHVAAEILPIWRHSYQLAYATERD